jgi:ATP-binding cassette subfamily B (MDR/TAP) protein 1
VYLFIGKFVAVYIHSVSISGLKYPAIIAGIDWSQVCISISAIRTTKALRIDFIKHVLRQNIAYFDSDSITSVTTQATTNGNNVNNGISEKLTLIIQAISTFVSAFVVAFAVQWKLTLITLGIVPAIVIAVGICIGFVTKYDSQQLSIYSRAGLLAEEVFSTVRTVHAFWLNPLLSRKYDTYLDEAMVVGMKNSPVYAVLFSTEFFCVYSGYGLAFWQGIRLYFKGEIRESGDVWVSVSSIC